MVRLKHTLSFFIIFVVSAIFSAQALAAVQASVDRAKIYETETLTLTITVTGDNDESPSFNALKSNFDLLSTSQSSSYSYINGRMESKKSWFVTLAPKRQGTLQIPAIPVGSEMTRAMNIEVLAPSAAQHMDEVPAIFIETVVDPKSEAYVQGQIAFSLKIFYATELQSGRLSDLSIDNAVVQRLGDDKSYSALRHGKRYNVIERRYAIFPQASGKLTIPQMSFQGSIRVAQAGRRSVDPFFDPFGRLGGSSKQVRVKSDVLNLNINPRPTNSKGQWWLPARDFKLVEKWSQDPPEFRVGEPVTRTITMQAQGLSAAQLPDIPLNELAEVKFYPDQAVTQDADDGSWIIGARQQKVALVPAKEGSYTLPAIEIHWWDTEADRERTAKIPAREITVLPPLKAAEPELPQTPQVEQEEKIEPMPVDELPAAMKVTAGYWPYIAGFFFIAWVLTALAWFKQRTELRTSSEESKHKERKRAPNSGAAKRAIKKACENNDTLAAKEALLNWGGSKDPDNPPQSLGQLALWFSDETRVLINELDRTLYSSTPSQWDGKGFWQSVASQLQSARGESSTQDGPLATLYPSQNK